MSKDRKPREEASLALFAKLHKIEPEDMIVVDEDEQVH